MGLLTVPKHYKPKGKPREKLIYATPGEIKGLLAMTDGRASKTRHGVLSFADDSASSKNVERQPSSSKSSGPSSSSYNARETPAYNGPSSTPRSREGGPSSSSYNARETPAYKGPSSTPRSREGGPFSSNYNAREATVSPTMRTETSVQGGRGAQAYDALARSYSNQPVYSNTNPFAGGMSTAFKGMNLSPADLLNGGYGDYQQPPGYSNPAFYSPDTPFGTLDGAGGRSEYRPGMNYSSGDYAQAGYGDYQQPPGAPPRQPPQFAAGGSPYSEGFTPPPMPGDFPQQDIRNVVAVRGGKGAQPYDTLARAYSNPPVYTPTPPMAKIQDRVPDETSIALDPSIRGRAMEASRSLFAGGVPGGYSMQPYNNPAKPTISPTSGPSSPSGSGSETPWGGYPQEPVDSLYGEPDMYNGDPSLPPSKNPITNTARSIAARLSGPLAKADSALGRMFPGMDAYTPEPPFGSNAGSGPLVPTIPSGNGAGTGTGVGNGSGTGIPGTGGGGGAPTPPPGPTQIPWYYPEYYTNWWSGLPSGGLGGYYTPPNLKIDLTKGGSSGKGT